MATQEEINQIAEQVEGLLKNKGKNISTAEIVETISNLTTIPAVDKNGNVVRVTLDAIKADSEIQTTYYDSLDELNHPIINVGIYKVSRYEGDVESGKLWVISNWGRVTVFQVLLSPSAAADLNGMTGGTPVQSGSAMYLCMRYYSTSKNAWSDWEDMIDKGVLRTVNIANIDNLGHSTGDFGSYDIAGGMASLFYLNSVMYYSQLVMGVVYLTDEGKLMLGGSGKINMFHRKRKYNGDWEAWEEYKPGIDTTPFVKTVEWSGETVKNIRVEQMSASAPGNVVLLVNDDNKGISFVYEVINNGIIPAYYGNWKGRENYQTGVYSSNTIGFTAGFFDNTLYVAPNSIWMVNDELRLVNKTPAPVPATDESGFIETTESQIDSLTTPGRHYKYTKKTTLLNTTYDDTCYLSVYQSHYKTTTAGSPVPEYTAIVQERTTVSYSANTGRSALKREIRSGYYINSVSELEWSEWKDATGTSSLESKISNLEAEVQELKKAISAK